MSMLSTFFEFVGFVVCCAALLVLLGFATGRLKVKRVSVEEFERQVREDAERDK